MHIEPTGEILGATVTGIDLRQPLSDELVAQIRAVWVRDLYELQRSLRPWYVRLWELIHGR